MVRTAFGALVVITLSACDDANTLTELEARVEALEAAAVLMIDEDMTINVPTDEATLAVAVASLDRYRIAPDATVVIQLEDGTHVLDVVTGSGDVDFAPDSSPDYLTGADIYWVAPTR
ncbi:MAG: hypothetical protein JRJ84_25555 [Deltaproteobacteria bacterium]|nr:hypothetical protein [Deltaproteobacteria bacterium]